MSVQDAESDLAIKRPTVRSAGPSSHQARKILKNTTKKRMMRTFSTSWTRKTGKELPWSGIKFPYMFWDKVNAFPDVQLVHQDSFQLFQNIEFCNILFALNYRQNKFHRQMVEWRRRCNPDHPPAPFRKNPEYVHAQLLFLTKICEQGRTLWGPEGLGGRGSSSAAGEMAGNLPEFCGDKGKKITLHSGWRWFYWDSLELASAVMQPKGRESK